MLCHCIGGIGRDVGDCDPQICGGFYVDVVVVAGRCAADVFQLRVVFHQLTGDGALLVIRISFPVQAGMGFVLWCGIKDGQFVTGASSLSQLVMGLMV